MKNHRGFRSIQSFCALGATLSVLLVAGVINATPIIANGDFETGPDSLPTSWTSSGNSFHGRGTSNATNWDNGFVPGTITNDTDINANHVAWIEVYNFTGTPHPSDFFEQTVSGFDTTKQYQISFYDNARAINLLQLPLLSLLVDGNAIALTVDGSSAGTQQLVTKVDTYNGQASSANMAAYDTAFHSVVSAAFSVANASAVIRFQIDLPNGSSDAAALLDSITITQVPEPMSISLFGIGAISLLRVVKRRQGRVTDQSRLQQFDQIVA